MNITVWNLRSWGSSVCDINYRLCPVTDLKGQVQDVTAALQWIFDHIHQYVGDSEQISVTGDSAGAQLAFWSVQHQRMKRIEEVMKLLL